MSALKCSARAEADAAERLRIATAGTGRRYAKACRGDLTVHLGEAFSQEFEELRHNSTGPCSNWAMLCPMFPMESWR